MNVSSVAPDVGVSGTPMIAQYLEIKSKHTDCLLFYRMGDFYELFFDDAVIAAQVLSIRVGKRGQHEGKDVPMAGVPAHAADSYLFRLIEKGFRVAVCEQVEDPAEARKRGNKAIVRREVRRIITPGTLVEEALLDARSHNYLAALAEVGGALALAWLDVSTGVFVTQKLANISDLAEALERLTPRELLLSDRLRDQAEIAPIVTMHAGSLTPLPGSRFDSSNATRRLQTQFGVSDLQAFGTFSRAECGAAGALLDYVLLTQQGQMPSLSPPRQLQVDTLMAIDPATRRNLELLYTQEGEKKGSLLAAIDYTVSSAGARLLAARLAAPLTDSQAIIARHKLIEWFVEHNSLCKSTRIALRGGGDIERALARLALERGGPQDLAMIRDGLKVADTLQKDLQYSGVNQTQAELPATLVAILNDIGKHQILIDHLQQALAGELPVLARDGNFIATGYAPELDHRRLTRDKIVRKISCLEAEFRDQTGINILKIKHNNMHGHFVEVTDAHLKKMQNYKPNEDIKAASGTVFILRYSGKNASRFTTSSLTELDQEWMSAVDKVSSLEQKLFTDLISEVKKQGDSIRNTAQALSVLDWASALATVAVERGWVCPHIDDGLSFDIKEGRHPVVEHSLAAQGGARFIANDCHLEVNQDRVWLLTGPNMAGKSTFLRQNALIAILAQMGSFVPAQQAQIGIVDRLFSRVGASDNLARGHSTFMVEMVETAAILRQAGPRAFVILDEIGRGTATYDGLSIAWACVEHLHEINHCRAMFATHYHELTALAERLDGLSCHQMQVREWKNQVVFLHKVATGMADRSYGIHVARLAGMPPSVIARAEMVLAELEQGAQASRRKSLACDLPLFSAQAMHHGNAAAFEPARSSAIEKALRAVEPDSLTPKAALELIYTLRAELEMQMPETLPETLNE